ncbi:MAG: hypothetical protein DMD99_15230 [Candidatus Rokuibacteriota bacterium]|nr:MAG: hypothetical protein DMD99_15230 [Candidatus Rokubacteria bacterium]
MLQPPEDVAHTHQDDDRLQTRVTGEHPFKDDIDSLRSGAGAGDASHMHPGDAQALEVLRHLKQTLEASGPGRVLVQKIAFRLTPADDECPVESGA